LRYRTLRRPDQLNGSGVLVIFSDMIARGMRAHFGKGLTFDNGIQDGDASARHAL